MLLPSALSCDSSRDQQPSQHYPYYRSAALFASPPTSPPPPSTHSTLFATCRALQSMLTQAPQQAQPSPLPTPPMTHAPAPSSLKLRLRSRKNGDSDSATAAGMPRKKIVKRSSAAPRGINKRRRAVDDDMMRDDDLDEDDRDEDHHNSAAPFDAPHPHTPAGPSTPKRIRLAPEALPLGLERSDFHVLATEGLGIGMRHDRSYRQAGGEDDEDDPEWTSEEDRILVELVLEKLKLSKSDWQDCARSLGKDRGSVGRRWKSLMAGGELGLKRSAGSKRPKIHGTWR
jgi:hypothetical protein